MKNGKTEVNTNGPQGEHWLNPPQNSSAKDFINLESANSSHPVICRYFLLDEFADSRPPSQASTDEIKLFAFCNWRKTKKTDARKRLAYTVAQKFWRNKSDCAID